MKLSLLFLLLMPIIISAQNKLRVGIDGLTHDHIAQILNSHQRGDIEIVGVAEPNEEIVNKYFERFHLPKSIWYKSLEEMVTKTKPEAVCAFNSILEHVHTVEICAPKGIHVMVEKPLATNIKDANKMAALAKKYNIHLLTNFETTWYSSHRQAYDLLNKPGEMEAIHKVVIRDGHQGPKEIGCSKEFLSWLTDPIKNGGGAVIDFGCYGANLMTWFMHGQKPLTVSATLKQIKPNIYTKVDDEAIIVLTYPKATAILEASWNWPFGRKDTEIYTENAELFANGKSLQMRKGSNDAKLQNVDLQPIPQPENDSFLYLTAVVRGKINPEGSLSSLSNNLIVVEILEKAIESAKKGISIKF